MFYLSSGPQYLLLMGGEIELRWENKRQQMHANLPECAAKAMAVAVIKWRNSLVGVKRK